MAENRDFDYAVCKVPRKDKNGNDVTGDKIGKGGRHRSDGTYSAPVTDIQIVDEDPMQKPKVIVKREIIETTPIIRYEPRPWYEQLAYDIACDAADKIMGRVSYDVQRGVDYGLRRAEEKITDFFEKKRVEKEQRRMQEFYKSHHQKAEPRSENAKQTVHLPDSVAVAYDNYTENMTSEEAQKELLEAFVLYTMSARKMWRVAHSKITDSGEKLCTGREMIESISAPSLIKQINAILDKDPSLLEEWQMKALEEAMGRKLYEDGVFVPIEQDTFQRELMMTAK